MWLVFEMTLLNVGHKEGSGGCDVGGGCDLGSGQP